MNELPYLHFEMHGSKNKDGLILKTGELVKWDMIYKGLQSINITSKNNLFISMASCYGAYLIKAYKKVNEPCPFYGFIGPLNNIGERDLEDSYENYFTKLLDTKDFTRAIKELKASNIDNPNEYIFLNSDAYFDLIIDNLQKKDEKSKTFKDLYKSARNDKRFSHVSNNILRNVLYDTQSTEEYKIIQEMRAIFTMNEMKV